MVGLWEYLKHLYRLISNGVAGSKRKSRHSKLAPRNATTRKLRDEKKQITAEREATLGRLPEAAMARAERELRDFNEDRAATHLEAWFTDNASNLTTMAKRLAEYHIAHAVPDPADHLRRARDMLRLARAASPSDEEIREISGQFDYVNAGLQAQLMRDGDQQIAWDCAMAESARGGDVLPLVNVLRGVAASCHQKGLLRLAPVFADRAADLARRGGRPVRRIWCEAETWAAFYHDVLGHSAEALDRINGVLSQARDFLPLRDTAILDARHLRASVLRSLGRYGEALTEIDAFAPVEAEVRGERHPGTLTTRYLRASVLQPLGRYGEALAEIDAFAPVEAEVKGERHPGTLGTRSWRIGVEIAARHNGDWISELQGIIRDLTRTTSATSRATLAARYRLARLLHQRGRSDEARAEAVDLIASFDRATAPTHVLLCSARVLLDMIEGRPVEAILIA